MPQPTDHGVAAALQQVLLPPELPDVEGWAMATLYEPAGETVLVGGDFYDWFTLPNGHVLFFVGDVSGKGPLAGALGMSIRKALKGVTWLTQDVTTALPVLQRALADEFQDSFATLCLVELAPGDGRVRVVLAGHEPPWVRHGGRFTEVSAPPNGVLGLQVQDEWTAVELVLEPSDMLVLFTDGLTEARLPDGRQFGDGPFQDLLACLPQRLSSYRAVLEINERVRESAAVLSDDVILGVLTFRADAPGTEPPEPRPPGPERRVSRVRAAPTGAHGRSSSLRPPP